VTDEEIEAEIQTLARLYRQEPSALRTSLEIRSAGPVSWAASWSEGARFLDGTGDDFRGVPSDQAGVVLGCHIPAASDGAACGGGSCTWFPWWWSRRAAASGPTTSSSRLLKDRIIFIGSPIDDAGRI